MANLFIIICASFICLAECRDYTGCRLLKLKPSSLEQVKSIDDIEDKYRDEMQVSFWNHPSDVGFGVNVLTCPQATDKFAADLQACNILYDIQAEDIQAVIDQEKTTRAAQLYRRTSLNSTRSFPDYDLDIYYDLDELENYLTAAAVYKPDLVVVKDAGATYENRKVKMIRIGKDIGVRKPAIWIDSGIHAREWIGPATSMYMIYQLITSKDPEIISLVEEYDWYFIPVLNPDGYVYSWTKDRLWRKNRAKSTLVCRGVDLNRNFDADFTGKKSSSTYPCSETYRGAKAFSEEETQIVREYITSLKSRLKLVITIHSYSQMWLFPYGKTIDKSADHDRLLHVSKVAMDALTKVHGTKYRYGNIAQVIYPASGSLTDWVYDSAKVKYSFAAELRDTGTHGFILPPDQIIPTSQEFWSAIKALVSEISKDN